MNAEQEFFDRVWVCGMAGKSPPEHHRAEGTPEGIIKGMLDSKKRVEKKKLGPWDDFEWEMLSGKLSALPVGAWG